MSFFLAPFATHSFLSFSHTDETASPFQACSNICIKRQSVRLFDRMLSPRLPLDGFPQNLILATLTKICWQNPNMVTIWQKYRHKSAVFEWNGIRPLGHPRRCKHYVKAPQCYVTRTLPILLINFFTLIPSLHHFCSLHFFFIKTKPCRSINPS